MNPLALFLTASGRLAPRTFSLAIIALYLVGFASQALLSPSITARAGLWPFAAAQALLIWSWYALHAKRLRDGGLGAGIALGIAALAGLAVLLLVLIMMVFLDFGANSAAQASDGESAGSRLLAFFVLFYLFTLLSGSIDLGLFGLIAGALLLMALMPLLVAVGFSVWTGTRPSIAP